MIHVKSEQEMKELGHKIGTLVTGAEVIDLVGDIGAGKTTLVKGLAVGMGIDEDVQSPSFTISRTYTNTHDIRLAHYDFYRLYDAGIMANELAEAAKDSKTVVVVEWAEIATGALPNERLTLTITPTLDDGRNIRVDAVGAVAQRIGEAIK